MKSKTITIQGKEVTLGYCNATEIGYKLLTGEDVYVYFTEAIKAIQEERMPDIQKTIYMIIAAIKAYSEYTGEEAAITDRELMYDADQIEIGTALGTIIQLRSEFYHLPTVTGEPEEKADPKNV